MLVIEELLPESLGGRDRNFVVAFQGDEVVGAGCIDLLPSRTVMTGLGIQIATKASSDRDDARSSLVDSLCRTAASWGAGRVFLRGWATNTGPSAQAKRNLGFQPVAETHGWSLELGKSAALDSGTDGETTERTLTAINGSEIPGLLDEMDVSDPMTRQWFIRRSALVRNPIFLLKDTEGHRGLIGFTSGRRNARFRICWQKGRQNTDSDARFMIREATGILMNLGVKRLVASAPQSTDSAEITALIAAGGTKHGDRCLWIRTVDPEIRSV